MPGRPYSRSLHTLFRDSLIGAIAEGQAPPSISGLGPATLRALGAIAQAHPDASVRHIVAAHEAFERDCAGELDVAAIDPYRVILA